MAVTIKYVAQTVQYEAEYNDSNPLWHVFGIAVSDVPWF